jgi:hypothetical protein
MDATRRAQVRLARLRGGSALGIVDPRPGPRGQVAGGRLSTRSARGGERRSPPRSHVAPPPMPPAVEGPADAPGASTRTAPSPRPSTAPDACRRRWCRCRFLACPCRHRLGSAGSSWCPPWPWGWPSRIGPSPWRAPARHGLSGVCRAYAAGLLPTAALLPGRPGPQLSWEAALYARGSGRACPLTLALTAFMLW